ncbi:non-ribosomal peptide synthetase [Streptomyces sp. NP-1717]|uniref:non-ribosomal peptide synthetase n=1 Tax=Streptomyces sp. NP-1717 TaxID=2704470 RepID=UPI001F5E2354|nr:non-ribosomal peptide synthetase [Streptomyces sp. NP-1717]MCI3225753.1 amino acid adenylation domain-containing protein [Streptomyces sp. NP-1717]
MEPRTYPMSFEQESIWLNDQYQQGTSRYLESWVHRLRGPLDIVAVEAALTGIVARHEALRSRLTLVDGDPLQIVVPPMRVPVDVRRVTADEREAALREAVTRQTDLAEPPLLKATLLVTADGTDGDDAEPHAGAGDAHAGAGGESVLAVAIHHAVIDGWCFSLLDQEFSELYRAETEHRAPRLPELPVQSGPYAERQRSTGGDHRARLVEHWRAELAGAPDESSFPADRPRPPALSHHGGQVEFAVDAATGSLIRGLAARLRTTRFVVLAAALTALIGRHSAQEDLVIGTPVSRRDEPETEDLIACLTDVLPLRGRPRHDRSFTDLVVEMKGLVRSAVRHKDVPYSHLVRELGVERTLSRFPLFQVVFAVDDAPPSALTLPGVEAERFQVHGGTAKYDVFLHLVPDGDGYRGRWEYSADLFDHATAERLAARFRTLVADAVARPETALQDLAVMPADEERRMLTEWAHGAPPPPGVPLVHEAFARSARLAPDAPAVVARGRTLSYAELDAAADRVAALLVARGAVRRPVGVCVERTENLPVAVLGVLKAGGSCVPVDPEHPAERIAFTVRDSGIDVLLTERRCRPAELPAGVGALLLDGLTDERPDERPDGPPAAPVVPVGADDLVYVIYTSGSTGEPKGVAMEHGPLANLVEWQRRRSATGPDTRVGARTLQFAPLGFDVAFQEIFATWAAGGTLVLVDEQVRRDPHQLLGLIASERIERLFLPFVALQQLVEYACATGRRCDSLKEVLTAGEQLHVTPALRQFFGSLTPATLENQYGPSETHVVTADRLGADPAAWPDLPSIGRPVDGATVVLLDERLRPVPPGAVGEICVGGPVVARGYVGRPELTAEKFVAGDLTGTGTGTGALPSVGPAAGGRFYRTGDLARLLPDGRIQYLGRGDGQVKIRGHRVETGEVEAAVRAQPGVADAAVVAQDLGPGAGKRLLAYYIAGDRRPAGPEEIRRELRTRLPAPLVPARCIPVDRFPLTSSGKVDRAALAGTGFGAGHGDGRGDGGRDGGEDRYAGSGTARTVAVPRTATQERIAQLWTELLGPFPRPVGVHDDFFTLGGDSLLATRLVLALREELDVTVPLRSVFTSPTVAGLAALVDDAGRTTRSPDLSGDIRLDPDIVAADDVRTVVPDPEHVLLTGATGFLGAFLLRELLRRTDATVHCLVRGGDRPDAEKRLRSARESYGLTDPSTEHRVTVVTGDLARPRLGLSAADFDRLARTVDAVYHAGAAVNLVFSYEQLREANVCGTREILRLAARHRTVPVHHVSTVGVYGGGAGSPYDSGEGPGHAVRPVRPVRPQDPTGPPAALEHGYTQSKWAAERLVEAARARGLPVSVYRPTRITGDSATGVCQTGDFMWLLLKGCLQAGVAPSDVDTAFDLVPVDYVSAAVVALSRQPRSAGRTFHIAGERPLRMDTALARLRALGHTVRDVPAADWLAATEADPGNAAFPLLAAMAAETRGGGSEGSALFDAGDTRRALEGTGIVCRDIDEALFRTYVEYFTRTGFLPPPAGRRAGGPSPVPKAKPQPAPAPPSAATTARPHKEVQRRCGSR